MSVYDATVGIDTVTQTSGNDELRVTWSTQNGDQVSAQDYFNGGDGFDTIVISKLLSPTYSSPVADLRSVSIANLQSYEAIRFDNQGFIHLNANAFGNGGLSNSLTVTNSHDSEIYIHGAHNFSLADWKFINWVASSSERIRVYGTDDNDTLTSSTVLDKLIGGQGNDTYFVNNSGDIVREEANEGIDTVVSTSTYSLNAYDANHQVYEAANVENLTLVGSAAINGTGNSLDNELTGNSASNVLSGLAGNDRIDGGLGADKMIGGLGNDTYYVDNAKDTVSELALQGDDTVYASASFKLGANVEDLVLTGAADITASGNALVNSILGNNGKNLIDGGLGADFMAGGSGDDKYFVDDLWDVVFEHADEGTDLVTSKVSFVLGNNVENLTLAGTTAINGTGNESNNKIVGNAAINILNGAAGDDILDGMGGADTMIGGDGNDTYFVNHLSDVVQELANAGTDTVNSSLSHYLGMNVENLVLTGASALNGTGNSASNIITGNGGANKLIGNEGDDVINGGAGVDRLIGGQGSDTLTGGVGNDVFAYLETNDSKSGFDFGIDSITDFKTGDKIDVTALDANLNAVGNQAFVLDRNGISAAGEIMVTNLGNNNLELNFYVDDDAVADMTIAVHVDATLSVTSLNELSFYL